MKSVRKRTMKRLGEDLNLSKSWFFVVVRRKRGLGKVFPKARVGKFSEKTLSLETLSQTENIRVINETYIPRY